MKKLLCAILLMASLAHAEEVYIADNTEGTTWYGLSETTVVDSKNGEVFAMFVERNKDRNDIRKFYGVMYKECKVGYGSLFSKTSTTAQWQVVGSWTLKTPTIVGDGIAKVLCDVYTINLEKKSLDKKLKNKSRQVS